MGDFPPPQGQSAGAGAAGVQRKLWLDGAPLRATRGTPDRPSELLIGVFTFCFNAVDAFLHKLESNLIQLHYRRGK